MPSPDLDRVLDRVDANLDAAVERLFGFLRIPSISTDSAYAGSCVAAAEWLAAELRSIGFAAEVMPTGGHPAVVAHADGVSSKRALFYGHYDVQPVDPLELWDTPPFEPRIAADASGRRRIVARGASDDKGQVMTFVEACRAWRETRGDFPMGLTLLIEGEEESGSRHLHDFLRQHKERLAADFALVCDTGLWDYETPAITTGLRGIVFEEVILHAASMDLHSGVYGGAALNPIHALARIVGALHGDDGRIAIPGFYDGVEEPSPDVRADWAALGLTSADFLGPIGLKHPIGEKGRLLVEMIQSRPTCDCNGIVGGYIGEGTKTVIPAKASAKVSFRLVGTQDPAKVREAFRAFVRARLPADCRVEFIAHGASPAFQVPADMPIIALAREALAAEWGKKPVVIGMGGSIPVVGDFKATLGLDTLLIGFALDDDRIHSPNEKYDLRSFHKGARGWARILDALA